MNKNIIYICSAALVGVLVGYLIFGTSNTSTQDNHNHQKETVHQMWTCAMHPQIKQVEPGDCPICGMELIPTGTITNGLAANEFKMTENAMALANIETTIIKNHTASDDGMITLSGKIIENEEANATQASYFKGRIERLNVNYTGQKINKGQKLATIYAPDLITAQQELITAVSLKKSQPALYKAVRNKLKLWKLSERQISTIESSGKVQENFPIYATVSGTVSEVMSEEGAYIEQGQPIVRVSNLATVWVEFEVYENQISQFKKGQQIDITITAYPDRNHTATISFIDPILNIKTRTTTIRTTLNNPDQIFKPGMFVTGKIIGMTTAKEQLTVPKSAVLWTGKRSVVYIKTNPNEPVFEMREVLLGTVNGDMYTILEGVKNGDEIVTNGTFTIDAAAQLQGKKSMMNRIQEERVIPNKTAPGSEVFQKEFLTALIPYLKMKDAFIASNSTKVTDFAKTTKERLQAIKTTGLSRTTIIHLTKSIEELHKISITKELKEQRAYFVTLNESIVVLVSNFNEMITPIYVQKCPMANTNRGAIWISTEKEIRNPYFGSAMLNCGSVIDTIK
ncbi:efflux RND transporter periplasmic adaptor subunit [Aquimarina longa]|uniref:efflux RND transporter periplasmic adaptor subunit n=1 Tax=Aquimarina longa TaxID=1080221 RepID=UPI0007801DF7|nr:efflux RND transporter periplasmic adaptor subunit [Aquimarina longa]